MIPGSDVCQEVQVNVRVVVPIAIASTISVMFLWIERDQQYGNDASNNLSYKKMLRAMDLLHCRERVVDEETKEIKL